MLNCLVGAAWCWCAVLAQDGMLNNAPEAAVRERIAGEIRRYKPDAIFTWSPYLDFQQVQEQERGGA